MRRRSARFRARIALAALAVGSLAVLSACGDSGGVGGQDDAEQDTSGGKVTLQYWTWFPPESTVKKLIDAYEKANPNVTIKLHQFAGADYAKSAQLALNGGGDQIDILGVQVGAMTKDVRSTVRPVKTWEKYLPSDWKSKLRSAPLQDVRKAATDGKLYEIPMGTMGSVVVFYNATMLEELGIEPPTTADQLAAAAAKIKAAKPDVSPMVFLGEPYWQLEMMWTIVGQTHPMLSNKVEYQGGEWTDPAVVQGIADYKSLFTSGAIDPSTLSLKSPRPIELFGSGKAAFLADGSWRSSLLSADYRKANDITVSDVGAIPFPIVEAGGKPAVRTNSEGGLAIPKSSTHVKEAAKFIEWMTLGDGVNIWGSQLLLEPSKKGFTVPDGVLASSAAKKGYAAIEDVLSKKSSTRISVGGFKDFAGNQLLDVLNGNKSPKEAAAAIQAEWTSGRYPHPTDGVGK